jgi:glycosyltransferase involved in cell wall biosynthesis
MNAGAAAASGDALLFLHADARLPEGAAEAVLAALADPAIAYGRFDVRFDRRRPAFRLIARLMNARSRLTGICTARKWEREGVARTVVLMWTLRFLYTCGVRPARLHRWYYGASRPVPAEGARISSGGA